MPKIDENDPLGLYTPNPIREHSKELEKETTLGLDVVVEYA